MVYRRFMRSTRFMRFVRFVRFVRFTHLVRSTPFVRFMRATSRLFDSIVWRETIHSAG